MHFGSEIETLKGICTAELSSLRELKQAYIEGNKTITDFFDSQITIITVKEEYLSNLPSSPYLSDEYKTELIAELEGYLQSGEFEKIYQMKKKIDEIKDSNAILRTPNELQKLIQEMTNNIHKLCNNTLEDINIQNLMKNLPKYINREIKMITKNGEIDNSWSVGPTQLDAVAIKAKKAITLTGFGVYAENISQTKSTLNEISYHFQILQPSGEIIRDWISRKTPKSEDELILEEKFEQENYIHMKSEDIIYIYQDVKKKISLHATKSLKQIIFEDLEFIENPNSNNHNLSSIIERLLIIGI